MYDSRHRCSLIAAMAEAVHVGTAQDVGGSVLFKEMALDATRLSKYTCTSSMHRSCICSFGCAIPQWIKDIKMGAKNEGAMFYDPLLELTFHMC